MTAEVSNGQSRKLTTVSNAAIDNSADYRVAVFGAGGVGKSSIVLRFVKGTFSDSYIPTIEDKYDMVISSNNKNVCTLQITDSTGSHQLLVYAIKNAEKYSKGHAFILVYSVTSKQSLEELGPIIKMLMEVKGDQISEVPIVLVGNKLDEKDKREVSTEMGKKLGEKWGCAFIETSAKNNENIVELFHKLLSLEKKRQLTLNMNEEENKTSAKRRCLIM